MNEKLNDALNEIRDVHIQEAAKGKPRPKLSWIGAVAAVLAVAVLVSALYPGSTGPITGPVTNSSAPSNTTPNTYYLSNLVAAPNYPKLSPHPRGDSDTYWAEYEAWLQSQQTQYNQPEGYADSLQSFFAKSIPEFLSGEGNRAYSPINVYLAMAMLAQSAEGASRQQILDLLGADSMDALQEQAGHVWNAHYQNDGLTTLLLANSLWLGDGYPFRQNTVNALADRYYASVFHGNLGTEDSNKQLQDWLNENTGKFLTEQAQQTKLSEDTAAALVSTIYFSAQWNQKFSKSATAPKTFHTPDGETTVPFMNATLSSGLYYQGEDFGAISLGFSDSNRMWLILPDEGRSLQDLLESGEYFSMLQNPTDWKEKDICQIHLSLPRFDISSQSDLVNGMKALGITEVFDPGAANLSGLFDTESLPNNPYVNKIDHAVRVAIDEEGCTAAAYTIIQAPSSGRPPEDEVFFTLDRPFLFVITSRDNLPLFAGTVCNP